MEEMLSGELSSYLPRALPLVFSCFPLNFGGILDPKKTWDFETRWDISLSDRNTILA